MNFGSVSNAKNAGVKVCMKLALNAAGQHHHAAGVVIAASIVGTSSDRSAKNHPKSDGL